MNVLLVSNLYPPYILGGAELIASYLAEGLAAQGHRVTVVSTKGPDTPDLLEDDHGNPRVIRFFPPNRYWLFERRPRSIIDKARWHLQDCWNRASGREFKRILAEIRPDIVHTHNIDGFSPIIWRMARRFGCATIHTAHDHHSLCPRSNLMNGKGEVCLSPHPLCRIWRFHYGRRVGDLDVFSSPSRLVLERHRDAGVRAGRMEVLANGLPLPSPMPRRPSTGELRLLMVGALVEGKGIRVALEAMRHLPTDARVSLDIAGQGPLEAEVRQAAQADPRIRYHGFVSGEQKEALFQADLLLFPALWYETMPNTIMEASARGLGVLASDQGAGQEFVDARNGLRFPVGDAKALADCIGIFLADPARLDHFRTVAPSTTTDFTIEAMVNRYGRLYAELVAR